LKKLLPISTLAFIIILTSISFTAGASGYHTDWAILESSYSPSKPKAGETVTFYVKVGILTLIDPLPQTVDVACYVDETLAKLASLTFTQPLDVQIVSAVWKATEGKHTVTWQIDPDLAYNDLNRDNNISTEMFEVGPSTPTGATATTTLTEVLTTTATVKEAITQTESRTMTETLTKTETKPYTVTEKVPTYAPPDPVILTVLAAILALTAWIKYELHQYGKVPPTTAPPPVTPSYTAPPVAVPPTIAERCTGAIDVFTTNLPTDTHTVRWVLKDEKGNEIGRGFFDASKGPRILKDTFRATLEGLKIGQRITVEVVALDREGRKLTARASGCGLVCTDKEVLIEFPADKEVTGHVVDGIYGWDYKYLQRGDELTLKLKLSPDPNVTKEELEELKRRWRHGIENKWSEKFGCCDKSDINDGKCVGCSYSTVMLNVEFVEEGEYATIRVRRGPARSNYTTWDTADTDDVAAHEIGHHLGLKDEYQAPSVPTRTPVNTGSVMDNNTGSSEKRHYEAICGNIGKEVVEKR